jgi:hypothetical protein
LGRAAFHRDRNDRDVFIAEIATREFTEYPLRIEFSDETVELNGFFHNPTSTISFSCT